LLLSFALNKPMVLDSLRYGSKLPPELQPHGPPHLAQRFSG
jgi:hypothetical protein